MVKTVEKPEEDIDSQVEDIRSRYDIVRGYFDAHVRHNGPVSLFGNILSQPMSGVRLFVDLMDMNMPNRSEKFIQTRGVIIRELEECERLIKILKHDPMMEAELWAMRMPKKLGDPAESEPAQAYIMRLAYGLPLRWFLEYLEAYVGKRSKESDSGVSRKVAAILDE